MQVDKGESKELLVSIIIPVYNSVNYIGFAIESALKQSYNNIEIIVVDDGSTDSSYEAAKEYTNSNIKVVKQVNKGASSARNYGLSLSKGDYIQFLDADDILHPRKIEHQIETLKGYSDSHLIGGKWQRFDTNINKPYKARPYIEQETKYFDKVEWLIKRPYMVPHTWLVSKKLILLAGPWNEDLSFNDDGEYFYRVIAASAGVVIDHKAAVYYRTGITESLSKRRDRSAMISGIESVRSYKRIIHTIAGDSGNESVNKYFFELSYLCLNHFPDLYNECKSEMYYPEKVYNLSDNLVYNLRKVIGLSYAKRVRLLVNSVREIKAIQSLIDNTKNLIGWSSY